MYVITISETQEELREVLYLWYNGAENSGSLFSL